MIHNHSDIPSPNRRGSPKARYIQIYVRDVDEDVWWQIMQIIQLEPLRIPAIDISYSDPFLYTAIHTSANVNR